MVLTMVISMETLLFWASVFSIIRKVQARSVIVKGGEFQFLNSLQGLRQFF